MADTIIQPGDVFARSLENAEEEDCVILNLFSTDHPEKFGMVQLDQDKRVVEIVDKPQETELTEMWGSIIWRSCFTDYLHHCVGKEHIADFAKIMNSAITNGLRFRGFTFADSVYIDLGTYEEILELDRRFREE